jgi:hypothetical protein
LYASSRPLSICSISGNFVTSEVVYLSSHTLDYHSDAHPPLAVDTDPTQNFFG